MSEKKSKVKSVGAEILKDCTIKAKGVKERKLKVGDVVKGKVAKVAIASGMGKEVV